MQSENLIQLLIDQTKQIIIQVEQLKNEELSILTWKNDPESWCILECLEHLNLYGTYYIPEIKKSITKDLRKTEINFKPGILGNYFAKSMLPKESLNKMKTFKDKNPLNANLDKSVISKFLEQQEEILKLLELSKSKNLNKIRIKTSISRFIKLKLGDTFRFFINHNIRHMAQIKRIESLRS